ncbi:MAG: hypothetical protein ACJA1D_001272, partial [Polaribacter sp.]
FTGMTKKEIPVLLKQFQHKQNNNSLNFLRILIIF